MQTLIFLTLACLPPLISGPVPAMLLFKMGTTGPNWRRQLPVAVLSAMILDLIAFAVIISNLEGLIASGFVACMLIPIAEIATLIVSLRLFRRTDLDPDMEPIQRRWLRLSLMVILVLPILMAIILVIIAPALCNTGIRTCTDL